MFVACKGKTNRQARIKGTRERGDNSKCQEVTVEKETLCTGELRNLERHRALLNKGREKANLDRRQTANEDPRGGGKLNMLILPCLDL